MGIITVESTFGPMDFKIAGDAPTPEENFKIRDIINNASEFNKLQPDAIGSESQSTDLNFDRTTGIQDAGLRATGS